MTQRQTESNEPHPAPTDPKPPRRRFTPEERIANREAEIARIKERQRDNVRELIEEAQQALHNCVLAAKSTDMQAEAERCARAIAVLVGAAKGEGKG